MSYPFRIHGLGPALRACMPAWLAFALIAGTSRAPARPMMVPFASEYQADVWDLEEGFPENSCSGVVTAPDNYLWFGTFRGLVRFNGQKFRHWGPTAMPELATTPIVNMYRERAGRVWLSTTEGLVVNEGSAWRRWQEEGGWRDRADYVRSYAEGPNGAVAFGRFSGRVTRREGNEFVDLPPTSANATGGAWCAYDGDGLLYVARAGFAGVWREGAWRPVEGEPELGQLLVGLGQDGAGNAVFFFRQTLLRVRGGRVVERVPLSAEVKAFWQLSLDAEGAMWLPALDAGVYRIRPDGEVKHFLKADGLPHSAGTRVVHADDTGGIWIGSGVGGIARFRPKRFRYVGEMEGLGERVVLTLAPLRDGRVLMTTFGAGPAFFDGVRAVSAPALSDANAAFVRTVVRTHDDTVWLGTFSHGLFRLVNDAPVAVTTGIFGERESINTMFEDSQHRLWVGGERHVALGQDGEFRDVAFSAELQRRWPTLFAERHDGTVLLAKQNEIFGFTAAGLQTEPIVRLPEAWRISTLLVDTRDRLWIGTSGEGLLVFDHGSWRRCPAGAGLPAPTISALVQDDTGRLWFGAGRAIVRADPDELCDVAMGRVEHANVQIFDTSDGLRALDLPNGSQPCVAKDDRGRLWFALVRGVAMVDPATLKLNTRLPPVMVESLSYVPHGASQPVEFAVDPHAAPSVLPAGSRLIRIGYAALDFISPGRQSFRVRLGGEQGRWQDMRGDTTISFLELPPGEHTVEIQASGSDGVWNRSGARMNFEVAPFTWQTGWFRGLVAVGFMGLVGGTAWWLAHLRVVRARESLARERRFAQVQDALRSLAMKLTESLEIEALGRAAAEASRALFGHDAFLLGVTDAGGGSGHCAYMEDTPVGATGPEPTPPGEFERMDLAPVFDGTPVLINRGSAAADAIGANLRPWGFAGRRSASLMFAPVIWNGRVTGIVSVQSYTPQRYREPDLQLLQTLAAHCGAAVARLQAESQLRESAERLRLAMQSARMGSWEIDMRSGRLMASPEAEEIHGCASGALSGPMENLAAGAPEPEAGELRRRLQDLVAGRVTVLDYVHRCTTPAGVELWLELKARVQRDGARERIIGVTADVTARRRAEVERNKLEDQLQQSQKLEAMGTLAGGIAHDFNNILTAILGNAELAQFDHGDANRLRDYLAAIKQSGLRARDLVQRILAFSRPRGGKRQIAALLPAVEEVVKLLRATIPASVELSIRAPQTLPPVEIDSTEIHQVLLNLGTNAWQALGQRPGRIDFVLETCGIADGPAKPAAELAPGRYARIDVVDTGAGIAPEILPRIFDPFFTTKRPGEGTGLGLSVAHGIMRANGGAITVQSRVGHGATFSLYFPVSAAQGVADAAGKVAASSPATPGRGERILYVDDEPLLVKMVDRLLSRSGYTVTGCTRPQDALTLVRDGPDNFDLVISDYSMPGMTGLELTEAIRRHKPDLPILLITGYQRPGLTEEARQLGVRAVVNKVDSLTTLLPLVARVLNGRK